MTTFAIDKSTSAAGKNADGKSGRRFPQGSWQTLRTGRANAAICWTASACDYHGTPMPVNQLGTVTGARARRMTA